ncbi:MULTISPECIES: hypothetical protein [unclassified Streptomyces]|uniref:hypothetical protein n=1 Tax=Streptomyces TaxID=1883 RepID=UPI0001C1BB51|nr:MULTISPECIES: hypothetical protein [unclassified Streptomyces]AEN12022.1 putative integral membrane protein [Streptomyces sp. SirexAA-E]PZX38916.1 hypothetical protein K373_03371 [Streptomyces sp. DvalAA-21]RAJ35249.1 hypothetical protein K351_03116 [Streptomyces sp. DpondAA-E10]RAJ48945.1 hypothetical protein K352_01934 [Streptomyces sp. DpondAA-A50]SCD83106.1 hypothetical protein GA0115239_109332 [Streptomyces sp. BpilaLS-43]
MVRRTVAVVTAIVLFGEAVGIVLVNAVLASVVDNQQMSLAGMDPGAMSTGTWVLGVLSGVLLVLCGLIPLVAAVRDRAPGRFARIALIGCAVVHGVLGALAVGLVGWAAFGVMTAVLALLVWTLVSYGPRVPGSEPGGTGEGGAAAGAPAAV